MTDKIKAFLETIPTAKQLEGYIDQDWTVDEWDMVYAVAKRVPFYEFMYSIEGSRKGTASQPEMSMALCDMYDHIIENFNTSSYHPNEE